MSRKLSQAEIEKRRENHFKKVEGMTKLQVSPTKWANAVEQLRREAETSQKVEEGQVNNAFHTTTKAELIKYLHQAAFSPVKATWKKAIKNGHFTT